MLNGSAFLRVAVLLIAAAALTGLFRAYLGHDGGLPDAPPAAAPQPAPPVERRRAEPTPPPPRAPEPAPAAPPAPAPTAMPAPAPAPELPPPQPANEAPVVLAPQPEAEAEAPPPAEAANPPGIDLVDLNTASVAQLNGLKGGGAIGRAIVQHRPYASVDQLLSKRVLSRTVYQRIKTQVTVR